MLNKSERSRQRKCQTKQKSYTKTRNIVQTCLTSKSSLADIRFAVNLLVLDGINPTIDPRALNVIEEFQWILLSTCFERHNQQNVHAPPIYLKHVGYCANVDGILQILGYQIGCQLKATLKAQPMYYSLRSSRYERQLGICQSLQSHRALITPCTQLLYPSPLFAEPPCVISLTSPASGKFCWSSLCEYILSLVKCKMILDSLCLQWSDQLTKRSPLHQREYELSKLLRQNSAIGKYFIKPSGTDSRYDYDFIFDDDDCNIRWRVEQRCCRVLPAKNKRGSIYKVNLTCGKHNKQVYALADFDILLVINHNLNIDNDIDDSSMAFSTAKNGKLEHIWMIPSAALARRYNGHSKLPQSISLYTNRGWTRHFHFELGGSSSNSSSSTNITDRESKHQTTKNFVNFLATESLYENFISPIKTRCPLSNRNTKRTCASSTIKKSMEKRSITTSSQSNISKNRCLKPPDPKRCKK